MGPSARSYPFAFWGEGEEPWRVESGTVEVFELRPLRFDIPLFAYIEDLGLGELFPGLDVHLSSGPFDQPFGVF